MQLVILSIALLQCTRHVQQLQPKAFKKMGQHCKQPVAVTCSPAFAGQRALSLYILEPVAFLLSDHSMLEGKDGLPLGRHTLEHCTQSDWQRAIHSQLQWSKPNGGRKEDLLFQLRPTSKENLKTPQKCLQHSNSNTSPTAVSCIQFWIWTPEWPATFLH